MSDTDIGRRLLQAASSTIARLTVQHSISDLEAIAVLDACCRYLDGDPDLSAADLDRVFILSEEAAAEVVDEEAAQHLAYFRSLLDDSSLGTPAARYIRSLTPREVIGDESRE